MLSYTYIVCLVCIDLAYFFSIIVINSTCILLFLCVFPDQLEEVKRAETSFDTVKCKISGTLKLLGSLKTVFVCQTPE